MSKLKKLNRLNKSKTLNVALALGLVASNLVSVAPAAYAANPATAHIMSTANKVVATTSTVVNKLDPQDVKATITTTSPLKAIKYGKDEIPFTLEGDEVTISGADLSELSNGSKSLKFDFESGSDKTLKVTITDKEPKITSKSVSFNNKNGKGKDVTVSVYSYGLTLDQITNAGNEISPDDYVVGTPSSTGMVKVTIKKEYLSTLDNGEYKLDFGFNGTDVTPEITLKVSYNVVTPAQVESVSANSESGKDTITVSFDKAITASDLSKLVLKQKIDDNAAKTIDADFTLADDGLSATAEVDSVVATTDEQTVIYSVSYNGATAVEANEITVAPVVVDTEKPVIKLLGDATMNLKVGDKFEDPGTTVEDNVDKDLVAVVTGSVDTATAGTYTLKYNVSDKAGNAADEVTRTVIVAEALPVVTSVSAINATTLEVVLAEKPAADPAADKFNVTVNGTAVAAPTAVTKLASDLTGKTYRLTMDTLSGQQGDVAVNGTKASVATGMVYGFDFKAPSVTSIVAKGPKTVEITFDEKISPNTTASTGVVIPENFTVWKAATQVGVTGNQKVVLDSTGTKVILTLDPAASLVPADYVVRFGEADQSPVVKDVAGNVLYGGTEVSFRPTAADLDVKVAPSLSKAEYNNGLGTLKLTFTKDTTVANLDVTKLSIGGVAITSDAVKTQTATNVITLTLSVANKDAVNAVTGALTLTSAAGAYTDGTTATTGESILITKTSPAVIQTAAYSQESKVLTLTFDQAVKLVSSAGIKVNSDAGTEATATGSTPVNANGTPVTDLTVASTTWNLKLTSSEATKLEGDITTKLKVYMAAGAVTNNDSASTPNVATTYTDGGVAVTYTADTTNPFIQSVVFDDNANTLKISFNENLDTNSAAVIANLKVAGALTIGTDATTNKVDLNGLTYAAGSSSFVIDPTDKKLFVITLGGADAGAGSTTFRSKLEAMNQSGKPIKVWLAKDTVIDNDNLKNVASTFDTGVVATFKDFSRPSLNAFVAATDVLSSTKIKVSFNEVMDKTSAQTIANYVITDGTGAQLAVTNAELQADGVTVYLTTAAQESGRPYNLAVKGAKDLAGNIMNDSLTNAFTGNGTAVTSQEKVSSAVATIGNNSKDDVIQVVFSEKPTQSLALDKANYAILEHSSTDAATVWTNATAVDISDATLTVDSSDPSAKTVKIALGKYNLKDSTTYKVVVSNVTDIFGNTLDTANSSVVTAATTSIAPALVTITETNTATGAVTMKFTEELKNADVATNYSVGGQTPTKATYTWDATTSQATVVLDLATALTGTPPNVMLTTSGTPAATNVTNLAGKGFASATIAGPAAYADKVAPTLDTVVATINPTVKDDTIVIAFKDNDLLSAAANAKGNYIVKDAQGTVIPSDDYTVTFNDNVTVGGNTIDTVTITFDQGVVGTVDRTYNLQANGLYSVSISGILDISGNVMAVATKTATLVNAYNTGVDIATSISGTVTKAQVGNVVTLSGSDSATVGTVSLTATKTIGATTYNVDIKKASTSDFALRAYNASGSQITLSDSTVSLIKTLLFGQLSGGASNQLVANISMNYGQLKTAMNNVSGTAVGSVQVDLFDLAGNKTTVTLNIN